MKLNFRFRPRKHSNLDARVYEGLRSLLSPAPAGHRFQKGNSHKTEVGNNFVTAPRLSLATLTSAACQITSAAWQITKFL
jgi:hypothetical protein